MQCPNGTFSESAASSCKARTQVCTQGPGPQRMRKHTYRCMYTQECGAGTFSAKPGMSRCLLCSDGGVQRYQQLNHQHSATAMRLGPEIVLGYRYQPSSGMATCQKCPENTQLIFNSDCISVTDCICQRGFWRPDGQRGKEWHPLCPIRPNANLKSCGCVGSICSGGHPWHI